jgi:hypothetical protein
LTLLGCNTGSKITSGSSNTLIGAGVGSGVLTTGLNNILIGTGLITGGGNQVDVATASTSHTINIANVLLASATNTATSTVSVAAHFAIGGHLANTRATTAPAINSGGALDVNASDMAGTVTTATSSTGFVITFGIAYATAPHVIIASPTGSVFTSYTSATTTLTVVTAALSAAQFTYYCFQ